MSCSAGVSEPDGERKAASEIPSAAEGSSGPKNNHKRHPFDWPALAQGRLRTHEGAEEVFADEATWVSVAII